MSFAATTKDLCLATALTMIPTGVAASQKPLVAAYFDVNKTILMSDPAGEKTRHDVVVSILASDVSSLFHDWQGSGQKESYYDFITRGLELKHDRKQALVNAERKQVLAGFIEELTFYDKDLAERGRALYKDLDAELGRQEAQHEGLLPSFVHFLDVFQRNCDAWQQFTCKVIIRTFGEDISKVERGVASALGTAGFAFERGAFLDNGDFMFKGVTYPRSEFTRVLREDSSSMFIAIQDNYPYWKSQNFAARGGKPLPILDDGSFTPFFDDNIEARSLSFDDKDIIYPYHESSGQEVLPQAILGSLAIAVNPFFATSSSTYFVDEYNKAALRSDRPDMTLNKKVQ